MQCIKIEKSRTYPFYIIYGIITLLILTAARLTQPLAFHPNCLFKSLTGFPCLTCGMSRLLINLSHFKILTAFYFNPLIFIGIIIILILMLFALISYLFHLPHYHLILTKTEKRLLLAFIILAVLLNWSYLFLSKI